MTTAATRTLYWTPRILGICMALFLIGLLFLIDSVVRRMPVGVKPLV